MFTDKLKIYIFGTKIDPIASLLKKDVYQKIKSSPNKKHEFKIKHIDGTIEYNAVYLGSNDIPENIDKYDSTNHCVILCFLTKYQCLDIMKAFNLKTENLHPFFMFYSECFNKREIISDMKNFYEHNKIKIKFRTSTLNVSVVKNLTEIVEELLKKYNYYNFNEQDYLCDNIFYPINIGVYGQTKAGKSTLINKLLGEKKSFNHPKKPTPKKLRFAHDKLDLVFYDTEGFDVEQSLEDANQSLTKFESIKKEVHVIYYVMNYSNRLMEKERKFLKKQRKNLNRIIFIGTHQDDVHDQYINQLIEDIKQNKIYNDEECEKIKNNIFCLDLINDEEEYNINEIKQILKRTFEICADYYKLIRDESNKYITTCLKEDENFNQFEIVKASRYKRGEEIINSRSWKIFGLGFIPIPFLDKKLMESQMEEMVKDLVSIYKDCKEEIFKDSLVGVVVSKSLGEVVSVGGGIATGGILGSTGAA